jgi:hypothetical protein
MKTRRNPRTSTVLLWGGALVAAGVGLHALSGSLTPPAVVPQSSGPAISIPSDIAVKMLNVWRAQGSPMDQARWVQSVQGLVPGMTAAQWALVYQQIIGFNTASNVTGGPNIWPDNQTEFRWVTQAAQT